eukprot:CAMPEP_0113245144 /NCGR_PEP_ID=MMETSP0008_2-20120614/8779_1 /TAXON_ID=97485 /ORGANISM="Prymnesium parvum" /LENGTH=477 /DNA_ID=CAMNT_0000092811 /DNA_START=67 /DNA_END=1500 /DNA_ORIENTATION=- /assembly_acc=CAM_ASM_000153
MPLLPLLVLALQLVAVRAQGSTCATIKSAYQSSECCGEEGEKSTNYTVVQSADSCQRPGCDSRVALKETANAYAGGTLYVYSKTSRTAHSIDLADAAIAGGFVPKHKPHMVLPSPNGKYVAVAYTADKFVMIHDSVTKEVVLSLDGSAPAAGVVGGSMHTGSWYGDHAFIMCDMTGSVNGVGGGALLKFSLDFVSFSYSYAGAISIGLTKTGRGTADTKPIAVGGNGGDLMFVTDAVGAGSVVNVSDMTVVKDFPVGDFGTCAGGGLWVEPDPSNSNFVVAQYGQQGNGATDECLFKIDLSTQQIVATFKPGDSADDAHGVQFCTEANGELYLINTNRVSATLDIFNYATTQRVVSDFDLNRGLAEPVLQPDVIWFDQSARKLYLSARGPAPVSAVKPQNFLTTATPGMFSLTFSNCTTPFFAVNDLYVPAHAEFPVAPLKPDVHSVWGVNDEVWFIDQAGTGSVQRFEVFSKCPAA